MFDAIVTDPPYSLRTALLNGGKVRNPFSSDLGSKALEPSEMCIHENERSNEKNKNNTEENIKNIDENENTEEEKKSSFSTSNTTFPVIDNVMLSLPLSEYSDCSVLEDLISFTDDHLICGGRLVFWWPEGTNIRTYIRFHD